MNGLSCGEEIMTIYSAVLIGCQRVTDRRKDRQTDVQPISITCFSIADARKKSWHWMDLKFVCYWDPRSRWLWWLLYTLLNLANTCTVYSDFCPTSLQIADKPGILSLSVCVSLYSCVECERKWRNPISTNAIFRFTRIVTLRSPVISLGGYG